MQNIKATFSCISETNVKISNLWPCISIIIGMINNTPILCGFDANFGNECKDLQHK